METRNEARMKIIAARAHQRHQQQQLNSKILIDIYICVEIDTNAVTTIVGVANALVTVTVATGWCSCRYQNVSCAQHYYSTS